MLATYNVHVPAFERLLVEQQGDMTKFHAAVETLSKLTKEERDAQLARLAAESTWLDAQDAWRGLGTGSQISASSSKAG